MQNPRPVRIYTREITPRLAYICSVLFRDRVELVLSANDLAGFSGVRINYSNEKIDGACQIVPYGLLGQQTIIVQDTRCLEWEDMKVFFPTAGDIPFDIFSAAFYLLSRYEEYLPHENDGYGRYAHTNSLAYREGFLRQPLVNWWMLRCNALWQAMFPDAADALPAQRFRFLPTYDVDIAYAYNGWPLWKNLAGFFFDLARGQTQKVMERGMVYAGRGKDPFDTFSWLNELHSRYRLQPLYFFLTILKAGTYDKNLPAKSKLLQRLYRELAGYYDTGLHPSWQSGSETALLAKEKAVLEQVLEQPVSLARFHYLRFTLPDDYRRLIESGFTNDYSMAYGTINGFRASYAHPFRWYDLGREEITSLQIHPFCFMEACSFFEQGYSADQAGAELQYFYDTVQAVNGELIMLFHNHFLTEQPEWVQWREMYAAFLERNCR